MSLCNNKIKRSCRLCLNSTEKHKRYELFVKSEVETDENPDDAEECQGDAFLKMDLYEKVEYCCGIRLAPKSQLPSKICGKCFYMIHMWFNFRQMSCKSQVILASETDIKLEEVSIAPIPSEIQQMRSDLLKRRRRRKEEFITPDPVDGHEGPIKTNNTIDKEELSESDPLCAEEDKSEDTLNEFSKGNAASPDPKSTHKNCDGYIQEDMDYDARMSVDEELHINDVITIPTKCRIKDNTCREEDDFIAELYTDIEKYETNDDNIDTEDKRISCKEVATNPFSARTKRTKKSLKISEEIKLTARSGVGERGNDSVALSSDNEGNELEYRENSGNDDDPNFVPLNVADENSSSKSKLKDYNIDELNDQTDLDEAINYLLAESDSELKKISRRREVKDRRTRRQKYNDMRPKYQEEGALRKKLFPPATENRKSVKEPKKYICNVCGNIHTNAILFRNHMRTHSVDKPYVCELCSKAFRTQAFLKKHMAVHTGEKRYKCKFCDLQYTDASSRHRHEKTHRGTRPYSCNICNKTFMYTSVLNRHVRLHSGDRNYSCGVCNVTFALPHHLKAHIDTVSHKEKQKAYEALGFKVVFETR